MIFNLIFSNTCRYLKAFVISNYNALRLISFVVVFLSESWINIYIVNIKMPFAIFSIFEKQSSNKCQYILHMWNSEILSVLSQDLHFYLHNFLNTAIFICIIHLMFEWNLNFYQFLLFQTCRYLKAFVILNYNIFRLISFAVFTRKLN